MNRFKNITYQFCLLVTTSSFLLGHEGAEYPIKIRDTLQIKVVLPDGVERGKTLLLEPFSVPSGDVNNILIEAQNGSSNEVNSRSLFIRNITGKAGEVKVVLVPNSEKKIKYFTDGHVYETSTHLVEFSLPVMGKSFQVRIDRDQLEGLSYEKNMSQSWLMIKNVFDSSSVIAVDKDEIFIPCSVCFDVSNGTRVLVPFRSYDVGKDNDFFDGATAWRWFGENHLMAQLLVTEDKFGMNSIKEKRVYVFNVSSQELSPVDVEDLVEKIPGIIDSIALDFDAEPLELTVLPVRVSKANSEEECLLMRLKPAEAR